MILSDIEINRQVERGTLIIDPYDRDYVQPSSVDVHLAGDFSMFVSSDTIDPFDVSTYQMEKVSVPMDDAFILEAGSFILGSTIERFKIPVNMNATLNGKSSLGRLGLLVHATAGYIDPGFEGDVTLELSNVSGRPMILRPGMAIGQVSFMFMERDAERPYGSPQLGSRYQGQSGPTTSRYGA